MAEYDSIMSRPLVVALALLIGCGGSPPGVNQVAEPLDPEAYRPHLVLLDAIIFEDVELAPETHLMLTESIGGLAREVTLEGDHPETGTMLTEELSLLLETVKKDAGKRLERTDIREEWLHVRGKFFRDAGWFRNSTADPVADLGPRPRMGDDGQVLRDVPGMDTLAEVFTTLFIIAGSAERDLGSDVAVTPAKAKTHALLTSQLARVDSLLAARTDFAGDKHFVIAWSNAREASRLIKVFIASDADTMPGSPGRTALEGAVARLSDGMDELEKVGS